MDGGDALDSVLQLLSSTAAQQAYFVAATATIIAFSIFVAYDQAQRNTKKITFRGRKPVKREAILRRLAEYRDLGFSLFFWFVLVLIYGVVIPAGAWFLFSINYAWFFPNGHAFVFIDCAGCVASPNDYHVAVYVFRQAASALIIDVFAEVLQLPEPTITHDQTNLGFSASVFAFRLYMQVYAAHWVSTALWALLYRLSNRDSNRQGVRELHERLETAN